MSNNQCLSNTLLRSVVECFQFFSSLYPLLIRKPKYFSRSIHFPVLKSVLACQGCHNKIAKTRWLIQQNVFFMVKRLEVQDWGVIMVVFLFRAQSSKFSGGHLPPPLSSHELPSVCICAPISCSHNDDSQNGLQPTHMTSFSLNYLFKNPISQCSYILGYWRLVI